MDRDRPSTETIDPDARQGPPSGPGRLIAILTIGCVLGAAVLFFFFAQ